MRKAARTLLLMTAGMISAAGPLVPAAQTDRDKALASLVEAERSFAKLSEQKGLRDAFLTFLSEKAIVFRPDPVEGRPIYEKMDPANPALLAWEPEFAETAASGELGYTTGPYRNSPRREVEPTRFGHYISIWKKQPDGAWKVLLDIGVPHGPPQSAAPVASVATPQVLKTYEALSPEALQKEELAFGERAGSFEKAAATRGSRKALSVFATDDVRVYRPGHFPSVGKRAFEAIIPSGAGRIAPGSERRNAAYHVGLAWSGDLAYSFGTFEISKGRAVVETTAYLRIWRKDAQGIWKICLDIELDVPPDAVEKNQPFMTPMGTTLATRRPSPTSWETRTTSSTSL
jgi:ketosteroid isomerase-like protein